MLAPRVAQLLPPPHVILASPLTRALATAEAAFKVGSHALLSNYNLAACVNTMPSAKLGEFKPPFCASRAECRPIFLSTHA